jgi:hypothetical protein
MPLDVGPCVPLCERPIQRRWTLTSATNLRRRCDATTIRWNIAPLARRRNYPNVGRRNWPTLWSLATSTLLALMSTCVALAMDYSPVIERALSARERWILRGQHEGKTMYTTCMDALPQRRLHMNSNCAVDPIRSHLPVSSLHPGVRPSQRRAGGLVRRQIGSTAGPSGRRPLFDARHVSAMIANDGLGNVAGRTRNKAARYPGPDRAIVTANRRVARWRRPPRPSNDSIVLGASRPVATGLRCGQRHWIRAPADVTSPHKERTSSAPCIRFTNTGPA